VTSVRGVGLLIAAELSEKRAAAVAAAALEAGLVVNAVTESALRLAPSLLVSESEIDQAVVLLAGALAVVGS
jgi:acetylornithine/N-succinyldiaminopimelate aminotransferase